MKDVHKDIMDILQDERMKELECAMRCKELMIKTINPFERIKLKRSSERFMDHSIGIHMAILRIERKLES